MNGFTKTVVVSLGVLVIATGASIYLTQFSGTPDSQNTKGTGKLHSPNTLRELAPDSEKKGDKGGKIEGKEAGKDLVAEDKISKVSHKLILKSENGGHRQCGVTILRRDNPTFSEVFNSDENGFVDMGRLDSGSYTLTFPDSNISLDSSKHTDPYSFVVDQKKNQFFAVFLTSSFAKTLSVEARITQNQQPLKNAAVIVNWRDKVIALSSKNGWEWKGSVRVSAKTKPGPAKIRVLSFATPETSFAIPEQGAEKKGKLYFEHNIESDNETTTIRGLYLDSKTRTPLAGHVFKGSLGNLPLTLKTDKEGRFVLEDIWAGYSLIVYSSSPAERLYFSQNKRNSIPIRDLEQNQLLILRLKKQIFKVAANGKTPELLKTNVGSGLLHLMPLTPIPHGIEGPWQGSTILTSSKRTQLIKGGLEFPLLPPGTYRFSFVLADQGTVVKTFTVEESQPEIDIDFQPSNKNYEFKVLNNGHPVKNALIIDGKLPHTLNASARRVMGEDEEEFSMTKSAKNAISFTDSSGSAGLRRSNPINDMVTVFTEGQGTFHLPKKSGTYELQQFKGTVVSGSVLDAQGNPVKGVAVQLTALNGQETQHLNQAQPRHLELKQTITDEQGRYEITGILPGSYLFSLCFYSVIKGPEGQINKHFQVDESSFKLVSIEKNSLRNDVKLKHHIKRCSKCSLYHIEEHH
jgi:hypothetical protein